MRIEAATAARLPQLLALERLCFSNPWEPEVFQRLREHILCAVDDGALLGYLCLTHVLDEGSVDNVAVRPDARRRGVADALLDEAERRAEALGLAFLTLEVRAGNEPAIRLYEKHGFERVGLRKHYYAAPVEDAVLMTRFLHADTVC